MTFISSIGVIGFFFLYKRYIEKKLGHSYIEIITAFRMGRFCHVCSSKTDSISPNSITFWGGDNLKACKSCQRNSRLDMILKFNFSSISDKFNKWVLSIKSEKHVLIFIFSIVLLFLIPSIIISNQFLRDFASLFNSFTLTVYWLLQTYRIHLCKIKNPLKREDLG